MSLYVTHFVHRTHADFTWIFQHGFRCGIRVFSALKSVVWTAPKYHRLRCGSCPWPAMRPLRLSLWLRTHSGHLQFKEPVCAANLPPCPITVGQCMFKGKLSSTLCLILVVILAFLVISCILFPDTRTRLVTWLRYYFLLPLTFGLSSDHAWTLPALTFGLPDFFSCLIPGTVPGCQLSPWVTVSRVAAWESPALKTR